MEVAFVVGAALLLGAFFFFGIKSAVQTPSTEEAAPVESPFIRDVNEREFAEAVLATSAQTPVLVDFWAAWCGPCRVLGPRLERAVAARNGSLLLAKVNADQNQALMVEYGISSIPTVLAIKNREVIAELQGAVDPRELERFLRDVESSAPA